MFNVYKFSFVQKLKKKLRFKSYICFLSLEKQKNLYLHYKYAIFAIKKINIKLENLE